MRWPLRTPRAPQRELREEELDELGRALFQAADTAPISPRAEAIRTRLLDSLEDRERSFSLVPAMLVAVLVAVIGIGTALGAQSIGSFIPPPVRTFLDDLLGPELTPPHLPPSGDQEPGPTPVTPDADPPDRGEPPRRPPVVVPTPVPAGPPGTTPTPGAGEGPPSWVPAPGPPVTPPTPPQTGPPGDAGP